VRGSAGLWVRWSWRDLRARWLQVAAIAMVVALGTGTYAGLSSTSAWRRLTYDDSYEVLGAHDLLVTTAEGTTVDADALRQALGGLDRPEWLADVSLRLTVPTQIDASTPGETILVPGRLVGVELGDGGPSVDRLDVTAGRPLGPADDGAAVVLLDEHFADHYRLPPQGRLLAGGGAQLTYVGHALQPQYFLIATGTGSLLGEAGYAVLFTSLATAQQFGGSPNRVNEAGIRLAEGVDPRAARELLAGALATALPDAAVEVTPLDEQRTYRILYDDIEGDQRLYTIFAVLILAGAAFAAFNLTGRIVEAQRREIGIGMALGLPGGRLALRPLLVALQIALLGVLAGSGVGWLVGRVMAGLLRSFLPMPAWQFPFQTGIFLRGAALGLALTFLASVLPVLRAVRVPPLQAIRTGPRTTAGGGWARFASRLPLPGGTLAQMPLRDLLRRPRRTVLTALGIAAAIATLIGVIGMVDSFLATIDRGETETLRGAPDRLAVQLRTYTLADSPEVAGVAAAPGVARATPHLQVGGTLGRDDPGSPGDETFEVLVDLVPFDDAVWVPSVTAGTLRTERPALVISEKAARDLGVVPGEMVAFRYPVREGFGYRWEDGELPVAGLHPNPVRALAYMDLRHAGLLNLEGIVNAVQVQPVPGTPPEELQRTLFGLPGVASAVPVSTVTRTLRETVDEVLGVLHVVRLAVLALALLIAFNSSSISTDERAREHATMFAFGVPVHRVLAMAVVESTAVGLVATAIGVLAGLGLLGWMVHVLLPATLPDLSVVIDVHGSTYLTAAVLGVAAVAAAPLLTARKLRRTDVPATLRVVE
jgi:putative ABC transport system permease protein